MPEANFFIDRMTPMQNGRIPPFTLFHKQFLEKRLIRLMMEFPTIQENPLPKEQDEPKPVSQYEMMQYIEHCLERSTALIEFASTGGGKQVQDMEALRMMVIMSQCGWMSESMYAKLKMRIVERNGTEALQMLNTLTEHNLVGIKPETLSYLSNYKDFQLQPSSETKEVMNWLEAANAMGCGVDNTTDGQPLFSCMDVAMNEGADISNTVGEEAFPRAPGLNARMMLEEDQWLDVASFPEEDGYTPEFQATKGEPWHKGDKPIKDGKMLPSRYMGLWKEDKTHKTETDSNTRPSSQAWSANSVSTWSDELIARPNMAVIPLSIRLLEKALETTPASEWAPGNEMSTGMKANATYSPPCGVIPPPPPPKGQDSWNHTQQPLPRIVFFLGGCTMAEVAAVRMLARKKADGLDQGPIVILTTGIITGDSLLDKFRSRTVYGC